VQFFAMSHVSEKYCAQFETFRKQGAIMKKKAWAVWRGGIKDGGGTISTETGVLNEAPYGFKSRFENGPGTNPEELIGAAHAGCFSMALSLMLGEAGMTPEKIETHAEVVIEKIGDAFEITSSHLSVVAKIPGADQAKFNEIANKAKAGCPVSKVLKAEISMDARLEA
jgi:osmotically inducible protein OsmC